MIITNPQPPFSPLPFYPSLPSSTPADRTLQAAAVRQHRRHAQQGSCAKEAAAAETRPASRAPQPLACRTIGQGGEEGGDQAQGCKVRMRRGSRAGRAAALARESAQHLVDFRRNHRARSRPDAPAKCRPSPGPGPSLAASPSTAGPTGCTGSSSRPTRSSGCRSCRRLARRRKQAFPCSRYRLAALPPCRSLHPPAPRAHLSSSARVASSQGNTVDPRAKRGPRRPIRFARRMGSR